MLLCVHHSVPLSVPDLPGEQIQLALQLEHLAAVLSPPLQKSKQGREKLLTVRQRNQVPDNSIMMTIMVVKMITYPVWMVRTAFNHLA